MSVSLPNRVPGDNSARQISGSGGHRCRPGARSWAKRGRHCRAQGPRTTQTPPTEADGAHVQKNRRRPTLPGPCGPSTIGAEGLNGSVRKGKRCFPLAIATGNLSETPLLAGLQNHTAPMHGYQNIRQALDSLVPVSYRCHHPSRAGLSTW